LIPSIPKDARTASNGNDEALALQRERGGGSSDPMRVTVSNPVRTRRPANPSTKIGRNYFPLFAMVKGIDCHL